jgi:hypothetical protein
MHANRAQVPLVSKALISSNGTISSSQSLRTPTSTGASATDARSSSRANSKLDVESISLWTRIPVCRGGLQRGCRDEKSSFAVGTDAARRDCGWLEPGTQPRRAARWRRFYVFCIQIPCFQVDHRASSEKTDSFTNLLTGLSVGLALEPDSYAVNRYVETLSGICGDQLDQHATVIPEKSGRASGCQSPFGGRRQIVADKV